MDSENHQNKICRGTAWTPKSVEYQQSEGKKVKLIMAKTIQFANKHWVKFKK